MAFDKGKARQAILKAVEKAVMRAENESAREGLAFLKRQSSGPFSTKTQRALAKSSGFPASQGKGLFSTGHMIYPGVFSKRRPTSLLPLDTINKQTGLFYRSWLLTPARETVWGLSNAAFRNTAPYAAALEKGTRWMKARPLEDLVLNYLQPIREANIAKAMDALMTK